MKFKYIRHETRGFFLWTASDSVWHKQVGELLGEKIISAGFVEFNKGVPRCFGESESLHIGSRPEDSELLAKHLDIDVRNCPKNNP